MGLIKYFGLVLFLVLVSVSVLAENFLPATILEGQEIKYFGYKHSNNSNIITSTKPYISCVWKPDSIDDGWKTCEATFEIENQNEIKPILNNPTFQFNFEKNNFKNKVVSYSDKFNLVKETYSEMVIQEDEQGSLDAVEKIHTFTKQKFYGFTKILSKIDTSKPFAIKVNYETPKYSKNQFSFSLSDQNFQAFIDPTQSSCGTLNVIGATYTLTQNVNSAGTCFTIGAVNVTLNCLGYFINYSTDGSSGNAFYNLGFSNATIKNCRIYEGSSLTTSSHAVYFNNASYGTIENNTIITLGNSSSGILLIYQSNYSSVIANNITTKGDSAGIRLITSSDSTLSDNTVITTATEASGILLQSNSDRNLLDNNTIKTGGNKSYGIFLRLTPNATILLNNDLLASDAVEIHDTTSSSYINYLVYNNSFGEIRWINTSDNGFLKNMDLNGSIGLGTNLFIGNNIIALNTQAFGSNSRINSSANLTFKNLAFNVIDEIKILNDYNTNSLQVINTGTNCLGTSCPLFSYTNGLLLFNTTSFSSFAVRGLNEVDVYNVSKLYTNPSHYAALLFSIKNIGASSNVFNWRFKTSESEIQSAFSSTLVAGEDIFVFFGYDHSSGGTKTVVANGTTANEWDSEEIEVNIG